MKTISHSIPTREEKQSLSIYDGELVVPRLRVVTAREFLNLELPPREFILDPILPTQGLGLLYSIRGLGKTYAVVGIGLAVASGCRFLKWSVPRPRKVLYIDGEMPAGTMQERISAVLAGLDGEPAEGYFRLITPDLQSSGVPSLSTRAGQAAIEEQLHGTELIILDNLSTLCTGVGRENEAESWLPIQEWALDLRRRGVSMLFVHHAGKGGEQRGTSRKEDILDTVMCLRHSADYSPEQGARFEVHFEKSRGVTGDQVAPFEVQMSTQDGACRWQITELKEQRETRVKDLLAVGMSIRDIAEETRLSKSAVHRIKSRIVRAI